MPRKYRYQILEEELTKMISTVRYAPHDPLPSYADLMEKHGYSIATIMRTFDSMEKKGLIYSVHGKGTFVSPPVRNHKILILYPGDGFYRESALFLDGAQKFLFRNNRAYLPVLLPLALFMEDPDNIAHTYSDIRGIIVFRDFASFTELENICRAKSISLLFYGSSLYNPALKYNTYLYDEDKMARCIADYLLEAGYREAGAVLISGGKLSEYRLEAFRRAAAERGLAIREGYVYRSGNGTVELSSWIGERSWDGIPLYAALGRDLTILHTQLLKARLSLPGEVGLIGVDRTELGEMPSGAPAYLDLPTSRDGSRCVSFLIDLIEKRIGSIRGTSSVSVIPGETLFRPEK